MTDPDLGHAIRRVYADEKRDILLAFSITMLMMIAEIIGGIISNSLALLSDAGHMLTDNLALILTFIAMKFASRPATERKTFGFYRLEILAALLNGVILVLISLTILYEAYFRIIHPQPVEGSLMLIIALLGLVVNIIGALVLKKHRTTSLNIRGAYLHIVGDALSSIGVVIGGAIILVTDWYLIDPILSILISLVIIYGAWSLIRESVNVLLEAVPTHISISAVAREIAKVDGVQEAYHIHLWTITSGVYALSAHVLINDRLVSNCRNVIDEIRSVLSKKFNVLHSTIQLECEKCTMHPICQLPNNASSHS
ncbi:MAG: cation diffusion facilitator family transporter [Nitrospirota bacterium]